MSEKFENVKHDVKANGPVAISGFAFIEAAYAELIEHGERLHSQEAAINGILKRLAELKSGELSDQAEFALWQATAAETEVEKLKTELAAEKKRALDVQRQRDEIKSCALVTLDVRIKQLAADRDRLAREHETVTGDGLSYAEIRQRLLAVEIENTQLKRDRDRLQLELHSVQQSLASERKDACNLHERWKAEVERLQKQLVNADANAEVICKLQQELAAEKELCLYWVNEHTAVEADRDRLQAELAAEKEHSKTQVRVHQQLLDAVKDRDRLKARCYEAEALNESVVTEKDELKAECERLRAKTTEPGTGYDRGTAVLMGSPDEWNNVIKNLGWDGDENILDYLKSLNIPCLQAENATLKAEVERLTKRLSELGTSYTEYVNNTRTVEAEQVVNLQAEVERLGKTYNGLPNGQLPEWHDFMRTVNWHFSGRILDYLKSLDIPCLQAENATLKAEVERLQKLQNETMPYRGTREEWAAFFESIGYGVGDYGYLKYLQSLDIPALQANNNRLAAYLGWIENNGMPYRGVTGWYYDLEKIYPTLREAIKSAMNAEETP